MTSIKTLALDSTAHLSNPLPATQQETLLPPFLSHAELQNLSSLVLHTHKKEDEKGEE